MLRTLVQDLRFGARMLVKQRSFTTTVLLTLMVCIGANTAIFSVVRSVLLKPLPMPDADRLVIVNNSYPNAGAPRASNGVPDYFDRLARMPACDELALFRQTGITLGGVESAERLHGVMATPSFYRIVGAQPIRGRIFTEDEGEDGKNFEVMLSYAMWQKRFGGAADIVGRSIRLGGREYAVVGVMPQGFRVLWDDLDVWLPAAFTPEQKSDEARHSNSWQMIGHLRPGATIAEAQQQLDAINAQNDQRFPQLHQVLKDAGFHTVVAPLQEDVVRDVRPMLYLLWGGVLFVLLIGAVNIANLVVVRSSSRTRELATRHAIGADLARLARQLLTETVLMAGLGGLLGLGLGWWALKSLTVLRLDLLPRGGEIRLDLVTAAIIFGLTLVVGLVIGLMPVARLLRLNLNTALREEGRGGTSGRGATLLRRGLATAQVAVAFVLLIGAGLMLASFRNVLDINPGFDPANVVTASVSLPRTAYKDDAAVRTFADRLLTSVRALPGVAAAGVTSQLPFDGDHNDSVIIPEGYTPKPGESLISPLQTSASDGYFEAMSIGLVRGRYFDARDTGDAPRSLIVDERLAEKFWPGRDPIGRRLYLPENAKNLFNPGPETKWLTVVGVVRNVQMSDPVSDFIPVGAYYMPMAQVPSNGMMVIIKTRTDPDAIVTSLRHAVSAIDPELPVYGVQTMASRMDDGFVARRVPMILAMAFGAVALFLAAVGIYGVLAYGVEQRRREIGIRLALGSSAREVFGLVLGDGAIIAGVGIAAGLGLAYFAGRAMAGLLYGVRPSDPWVLGGVVVILAVVALVATFVPARRASRVDPVTVLNQ